MADDTDVDDDDVTAFTNWPFKALWEPVFVDFQLPFSAHSNQSTFFSAVKNVEAAIIRRENVETRAGGGGVVAADDGQGFDGSSAALSRMFDLPSRVRIPVSGDPHGKMP